jgi:hypothetical protein
LGYREIQVSQLGVVLLYTCSHIGWKIFGWIKHGLNKWEDLFGMCMPQTWKEIDELKGVDGQ